ncbi:TPA_asm: protein 4 [Aconitum virus 1]|uniref:Protein 4 n=1 Tax=Aconitum virus 1 TaxID=2977949 RepID=A0A9N7AAM0_9RHAB|nr:TPA_asm: protein 4 [Aconitum virus 1]
MSFNQVMSTSFRMTMSDSDSERMIRLMDTLRDPSSRSPCTLEWQDLVKMRKEALDTVRVVMSTYSSRRECSTHKRSGDEQPYVVCFSIIRPFLRLDKIVDGFDKRILGSYLCWECVRSIISENNYSKTINSLFHLSDNSCLSSQRECFMTRYEAFRPEGFLKVRKIPDVDTSSTSRDSGEYTDTGISTPTVRSGHEIHELDSIF